MRDRLRKLMLRLKRAVVQDCPPELYACEVCGKVECDHAEWAKCEKRIAAAEFMLSANQQVVNSEVEQTHALRPSGTESKPTCHD